ncbi:alpha/beta hydrolase [Hymenobacter aerophilus]|uniref:alpha/beta hydrolase n=1 Tax=Hymenobacter aerophilus TaxID=119644 RepID=UPI0003775158|nr:alpha/beta fold hydrolase [Hymenobacter aerophilus]
MIRFCLLAFLLFQTITAWASKPLAAWWAKPDTLGMKYQQLTLTTPDHVHLAAWLVEPIAGAPDQHTTMVLAGSDYGNMSYQLGQAQVMAAAGYQVMLFDYRGFGHSEAFAIDPNRLYYPEFATDLRTAFAEVRRRLPHQRVGILGYSMGAILGAKVAATTKCDFLITDSYIANPQGLVVYYATKQKTVTLPLDASTYQSIPPKVKCPWLLITPTQDPRSSVADALAIAQATRRRQRRDVLAVKCDHLGAMDALTSDVYTQKISNFLAGKSIAEKS